MKTPTNSSTTHDSGPDEAERQKGAQARGATSPLARLESPARARGGRLYQSRDVLITGGAGFVGCNLADRLLAEGYRVRIFDNFSRAGVEANAQWLQSRHPGRLQIVRGDVRDEQAVDRAMEGVQWAFHFAAQVAVTTSLVDPIEDFEVNVRGTLNVLEAMRRRPRPPSLVFTSTNKVYGDLGDVELTARDGRYEPANLDLLMGGVSERRPLDFHSPYGCSKGAADQYVLDFARSYGLHAAVFRMSCIYGLRQFGNEDQGWVAHFIWSALAGEPLTIYGDGRQVRDILFAEDLVEAFMLAQKHMSRIGGRAFNIGGGPGNAISLIELLGMIGRFAGRQIEVTHDDWREGDQKYYVSNTNKFGGMTGWYPKVLAEQGVRRLFDWAREHEDLRPPRTLASPAPEMLRTGEIVQ